jgi:hypothetical protein
MSRPEKTISQGLLRVAVLSVGIHKARLNRRFPIGLSEELFG